MSDTGRDVQSLLGDFSKAVEGLDKDDLRVLAKMHGWCEELSELTATDGAEPCLAIHGRVQAMCPLLEALILGEAENTDDTASSIAAQVRALVAGDSVEGETSVAPAAAGGADQPAPVGQTPAAEQEATPEPEAIGEPADQNEPIASTSSPMEAVAAQSPPVESESSGESSPAQAQEPGHVSEPLLIDPSELDFVAGFVEEAGEHIEAIEAAVLEVEREPGDAAKIDDLFRPFHTIKGMAGFLNLRDVGCLTHEVETLLDQGRKGNRQITPGLIDLVFDVVDVLKVQIGSIAGYMSKPTGKPVPQPPVTEMIGYLRRVVAGQQEPGGRQACEGSGALKVGENLVEQGAVPQEVVDYALAVQKQTGKKTGEILMETKTTNAKAISQAIRPQAAAQSGTAPTSVGELSVRIETGKLDALVDMVGELVIAQTLVATSDKIASDPQLTKDVGQVAKIVRDVQESAMSLRMIPIGGTFQKMARLVRDVSRKANKQVELHISGEDTELDKNVIQQIGDPLVHMVRNAVDHGVESTQERVAAGKDATGHVYLSAFHHGGNIVIEIRDDGRGMNPTKLIAKGVEKGMVQLGAELSDQEAYQLVFAPGFSMAAQVTDISGRGVGMDVVKRNIEQLRGNVEISSKLGGGSTFSIRLPLTLAIIDGMVVRVGPERFIIQTIVLEQALRPNREQITTVQQKGEVLQVRGRLIPLIQLGEMFGLSERRDPCEAMVAIAHCEGRQIGLIVDDLIGQQQVVIKSLGERFEKLRGICGAAILGDGRVGLILEMNGLEASHEATRGRDQSRTFQKELGEGRDQAEAPTVESEEAVCRESESRPELVTS